MGLREQDVRVFSCINGKKGALKWSEIVNELGMSREQIEESVRRLKDSRLLVVNQRSCFTTADTAVRSYLKRNKGTMKWSEAIKELGMSREQIEESVRRLKDAKLSEEIETS
jgi:DNA-binding transcriptional regulator GbsR (MarR family)